MTREKAIKEFVGYQTYDIQPSVEATKMAIKALEQEPCEDAISRQAVLDCLTATGLKKFDFILDARDKIKNLPPVTPQPKTGRWIDGFGGCECSVCGCLEAGDSDYCPNCGAKMEV